MATSNITTIKTALIQAHDDNHNTRAIGLKDCEALGITEQSFDQWCEYVEDLRATCSGYMAVAEDPEATDKAIQTALGKVWSAWRGVVKQGTEKDFNRNFFIRKNDANTIAEWCGRAAVVTARGRVWSTKGKADFRRHVEMLIGIRMAGNKVLTDKERDVIVDYESAVKTIKRNEEALKDKTEHGKTVCGLRSAHKGLQKKLDEQIEMLTELGIDATKQEKILEGLRQSVHEADKAVQAAEEAIKEAEKVRDEKQKDYDATIALLKSIGDR